MEKHNPYLFYQLSKGLAALQTLPAEGGMVTDLFFPIFEAQQSLRDFIGGTAVLSPSTKGSATALLKMVDSTAMEEKDGLFVVMNKPVSREQVSDMKRAVNNFEIVLSNDCPNLDIYSVAAKGIYSTPALLEQADVAIKSVLSVEEQGEISEDAYRDFREAGRCLALELSTASGFHVARSVESVVRRYWSKVTKKDPSRAPSLASCIEQLRKAQEDAKVLDVLDHFRDLHRNTLMHPEVFLGAHEAMRLFDIAKSAISAIAARMHAMDAPR